MMATLVYNLVMIIGRAVFWELQNVIPALWYFLDYTCDLIYLLDMAVRANEGTFALNCVM